MLAILAIALVQLTGPTGGRIDINPAEVTSLRDPAAMTGGHWSQNVHCIAVMSNGRFIALREGCDEVRQKLADLTLRTPSGNPCIKVCGEALPR